MRKALWRPLGLLSVALSAAALSEPMIQTGRYTAVATGPTEAEREPLKLIVAMQFADDVTTVGAALRAALADTGYTVAEVFLVEHVRALLERPLPAVQRRLSPMSVREVLETLVGPAFRVVVGPIGRTVAIELEAAENSMPAETADRPGSP